MGAPESELICRAPSGCYKVSPHLTEEDPEALERRAHSRRVVQRDLHQESVSEAQASRRHPQGARAPAVSGCCRPTLDVRRAPTTCSSLPSFSGATVWMLLGDTTRDSPSSSEVAVFSARPCAPESEGFSCRTPAARGKQNPGRPLSRPPRTHAAPAVPGRTAAASALHPSPPLHPCASLGLMAQLFNVTQASPTASCVHWPQGVVQRELRTLRGLPVPLAKLT